MNHEVEAQVAEATFEAVPGQPSIPGIPGPAPVPGQVQVNIEAVITKLKEMIGEQSLRIAMLEVALAERGQ